MNRSGTKASGQLLSHTSGPNQVLFTVSPTVMFTALFIVPLAASSLILSGCGSEPPQTMIEQAVAPPPSIRGETPAPSLITLDPEQATDLDVQVVAVSETSLDIHVELAGTVEPSPEAFAIVSAPISGRVSAIYAHEGEPVRAGQTVAVLESLEFAGLVADFIQARAERVFSEQEVTRYTQLVEKRVAARNQLERAEADLQRHTALEDAAKARLFALGLRDQQLDEYSDGDRALLKIVAPRSGHIDVHNIDLGQAVRAYDEMLTIVDGREVLVRGLATPSSAVSVSPGDSVFIRPVASDDVIMKSLVTSVGPALDEATRSVPINVLVSVPDGAMRPGQRVRMEIETTKLRRAIYAPLSSITFEGDQAIVFVLVDENVFEARAVELSDPSHDMVVVDGGLEAGEVIATTQVFSLKALTRFEQYGEE